MYRINLINRNRSQRIHSSLGFRVSTFSRFTLLTIQFILFLVLILNYLPGTFLMSIEWLVGNQLIRISLLILSGIMALHFAAGEHWKSLLLAEITLVLFLTEFFLTTPILKFRQDRFEEYPLRVLTVNNNRSASFDTWIKYCVNNSIDIAGFQEISELRIDNYMNIAKEAGYYLRYINDYPQAHTGVLILSKGAILESKPLAAPSSYKSPLRSSLYVTTQIQNVTVNVITGHLEPYGDPPVTAKFSVASRMRYEQSKLLAEKVKETEGYWLVLGDFNATPTDRSIRPLKRVLEDTWSEGGFGFGGTWPGELGIFRIDYILQQGFHSAYNARIIQAPGSDHRAYRVDISW